MPNSKKMRRAGKMRRKTRQRGGQNADASMAMTGGAFQINMPGFAINVPGTTVTFTVVTADWARTSKIYNTKTSP